MRRLDLQGIGDVIHAVRSHAGSVQSNYFYAPLRSTTIPCVSGAASAVFLDREPDFWRVFFASADLAELSTQLAAIDERPLVVELVTRTRPDAEEHRPPETLTACEQAGFAQIGHYQRMVTTRIRARRSRSSATCAGPDRAAELHEILRRDFDVRLDRLPTRDEVDELVAAEQAIIHTDEHGEIDGYVVYRMERAGCHLNYWHCRPGANPGLALKLLADFFTEMSRRDVPRVHLWVETGNTGPIRTYRTLGFRADGIQTRVLSKG